jgi:hypothetical protein
MILKTLKRTLPTVLFAIIAIAIITWLKAFLSSETVPFYFDDHEMPLYHLVRIMAGGSLIIERIIAFSVMIIAAFLLVQLNTKHILIKYRTYLPALFYILLSSGFIPLQRLNPAVFATIFLIFAIDRLFSAHESTKPLDNFFTAGFLVAIASLFYFPAVFFILLIFISIIVLNLSGVREWLSAVLGFLTPWFFFFFYHYFFYNNPWAITELIFISLSYVDLARHTGALFIILYSYAGLLFLIGLLHLIGSMPSQKISIRKYYRIFLWFAAITATITFIYPFASIEIIYLAAVPASLILSNYFTFIRSRFWSEFLFSVLAILILLIQIYY